MNPKDAHRTQKQRDCIAMLEEWAFGRHHLPEIHSFGEGVSIHYQGDLASFDMNRLTRLVILAHAHAVRVEIAPCMRYVRIIAHKREAGNRAVLGTWRVHPTLDDLVTEIQAYKSKGEPK